MKKISLCLISVILLLAQLVSCDFNIQPPDIYRSYVANYYLDPVNIGMKMEIDYWLGGSYDAIGSRARTKKVSWDGVEYIGEYDETDLPIFMEYSTDYYKTEDGITFGISAETNDIVFMDFSTQESYLVWFNATPIDDPQGFAVKKATEYLKSYSRNIEDYELTIEEPKIRRKEIDGVEKTYSYHTVQFTKKKYGKYVLPDYVRVRVTSSGDVESVKIGAIGNYDKIKGFDEEPIYESIDQKIRDAYSNLGYTVTSYTFGDQIIGKNPYHAYCLYSNIDVVLEKDNVEYTTYIGLVTIIGYKI